MARKRHLRNAPLREALIDIQFDERLTVSAIDRFVASVSNQYPKRVDVFETVFGIHVDGSPSEVETSRSAIGRRLEADNRPYVVQCRMTGFTVSRLSPYGMWDELRTEASELWDQFQAEVGRLEVNRIAVRYVNEINVPLPMVDFGEYFVCPPQVPEGLPQAMGGFLTRVVVPDDEHNCISVVTQAMDGPPLEGRTGASITVLLDIDVFRQGRLDPVRGDMWMRLDQLREQKNRMFFGHLTEKTVEMYE